MSVVFLGVAILAVLAMVGMHYWLQRRLAAEVAGLLVRVETLAADLLVREESRRADLDKLESDRTALLYKQQKQSARVVAVSNRAVAKMSDEVRTLHRDATEMHKSVDRMVRASENG